MPLLVRAAPERNTLRRVTTLFLWLTMKLAALNELDGAFQMFSVCAAAARLLVEPSRRHAALLARCAPVGERSPVHCSLGSWQKGINRVVIWSFDNMFSEHACWEYFRFRKEDMPGLLNELGFPTNAAGMVRVMNQPGHGQRAVSYSFQPIELLCTFLWRMAYPGTWDRSIGTLGGRSATAYKYAFYYALNHIYDNFARCINDINRWAGNCADWAAAIHAAGAPAPRCIGFIDGTFRPCCRPIRDQRQVYSGYYKGHGLKFQSVTGPNGLIIDLFACVVGRRGDGYLLHRSRFLRRMARLVANEGSPYYVYGDPAYALTRYILRGHKGAMSAQLQAWCTEMSRVRCTVEWGFGLVIRDWAFLDYKKNIKLLLQPIGKLYFVGALLMNIKTCMSADHPLDNYGNQVASKFLVSPPSLHDYLHR